MGIDYGAARIGVALGDTDTRVATPWRVLAMEDPEDAVTCIGEIARTENVEQLVVGVPWPLADQKRETDQVREIRAFIEHLKRLGLPIAEENETWSSVTAARQTLELEQKGKRDDLAAAAILQQYLDRTYVLPA